jgi:tetratricopeptide (TPR) repeat protein
MPATARRALIWGLAAVVAWFAVWMPFRGDRLARDASHRLAGGDPAGAAALLHRASAAVPIQSYYRARMAALHGEQFRRTGDLGALASAVRTYDRAIQLNPREWSFRLERAGLFLHLSRSGPASGAGEAREAAKRGYRKVLQLNPHHFAVRAILAGMAAEEGNHPDAVRQLQRAVADEPNFIRGRLMLAGLLESLGRTEDAEEQRREAAQRRQLYPQPLPGWSGYERELLRPTGKD